MQDMTRIFENDSDCRRFSAVVTECTEGKNGWEVVLDRTAFFPEGGGQPCDMGVLRADGALCTVTEVHEREGKVRHSVEVPLAVGTAVTGEVDWTRRRDAMEQHTGEHILSGTLHRLYGAENVGFHIGPDLVRMDMSIPLSAAQLAEAEETANRVVRENVPVIVTYPTAEELAQLTYRSKKEIEGQVRIVEIPGTDICACCGTHLSTTGQVGMIKILSHQNYKGGTRLTVACGGRAFAALAAEHDTLLEAAQMMSVKPLGVTSGVERLLAENNQLRMARAEAENLYIAALAERVTPGEPFVVLAESFGADSLRRLALACGEKGARFAAAFAAGAQGGLSYAVAAADARPIAKALNEAFRGRGGGKPPLCQGSLADPDFAAAEQYLKEHF